MLSGKNSKHIIALDVDLQEQTIQQHNDQHKGLDNKIPLVLRNQASGWPLLQVSFLSPTESGAYTPALGGGKCHDFNIPLLGLAILLAQVQGKKTITIQNKQLNNINQFNFDNIYNLDILNQFTFTHNQIGITLELNHNGFGVVSTITTPDENDDSGTKLANAMWHILGKVTNNIVPMITGWNDKPYDHVTSSTINQHIEKDQAIFHHGQVFVDLGLLLTNEKLGLSTEFIDYMRNIFKVNEFNQLNFPTPRPSSEEQDTFLITSENQQELAKWITDLEHYGDTIIEQGNTAKGNIVKEIAISTRSMLNDFFEDTTKHNQTCFAVLKQTLIANLNSHNNELGKYRINYLTIAYNIAIALTGIGAIALGIQLLYSKINTGRTLGFFASPLTSSEAKRNDVITAINNLTA